MAITTSRLMPRILPERSSSFALPSGLTTDLSKSKSTSAAKVTFSATGLGFGGSGFGSGFRAGCGAGAGAGGGAGGGAGFGSSVAQATASAVKATRTHALFLILPPGAIKNRLLSMACERAERILPQGHAGVQAREGAVLQRAVAKMQLACDPYVTDMLAPCGVHQMRNHVVTRREFGAA